VPSWTPDLALGVDAIDRQHRELFRRADRLLAAMQEGRLDQIPRMLQFVDDYATEHFAVEEDLMRDRGYPGRADHEAEHRLFLVHFGDVVEAFRARGETAAVAIALQRLVHGWLRIHVGSTDRKLAAFLHADGEAA
jgi:hemerythrin